MTVKMTFGKTALRCFDVNTVRLRTRHDAVPYDVQKGTCDCDRY